MPPLSEASEPTDRLAPRAAARSVGVFDSGVGGLSVLRAIRNADPSLDLVYVADSRHAPYGDRDDTEITARTLAIGGWLAGLGVSAVTVACNTATAVAVAALRSAIALPVVAIEPAIKPAVRLTRRGVVGVLATAATVRSPRIARLCEAHAGSVRVLLQACPGLAEQVEAGDLDGPATRVLVERAVTPLREAGADALVLGCTHYPFLAPALHRAAGDDVVLVDPAQAVARELLRRLPPADGRPAAPGRLALFTTGDPAQVDPVVQRLWPGAPPVQALLHV